jgi:hypothetical protein
MSKQQITTLPPSLGTDGITRRMKGKKREWINSEKAFNCGGLSLKLFLQSSGGNHFWEIRRTALPHIHGAKTPPDRGMFKDMGDVLEKS